MRKINSATGRTLRRRLLVATTAALFGAILWAIAAIGAGHYLEDLCFDDLTQRPGYGGYQVEAQLWPPSYKCSLRGKDVDSVVVQHPVVAFGRLALVALPAVYFAAVILAALFWDRLGRYARSTFRSRP